MRSITDTRNSPPRPPSADPSSWWGTALAELRHLKALFPLTSGSLSPACVREWPACSGEECPVCGDFMGKGVLGPTNVVCPACIVPPPFDFARSLFPYEDVVREGIRAAKYGRHAVPSAILGERLFEAIRGRWADRFPTGFRPTVVPVPIRPLKYFWRGFNLPGLVGHALARRAGWPIAPLLLQRRGEKRPQAGLRLDDREENVRGAFRVPSGVKSPSDLLLLDDIYTSGATAAACASALKTAGARHVGALTVARATAPKAGA